MSANPLLLVDHVSKRYPKPGRLFSRSSGHAAAVDDASFHVNRGEIVGVVGESGCGKSTLARLVLRLIEPTSGAVWFDGENISAAPKRRLRSLRKRMQMVFQDPYSSFNPRRTIEESITEPLAFHGSSLSASELRHRALRLLEDVGLRAEHGRAYPHQLSGGQRQRASIARALLLEPELLVLDEPTASLDVSVQAQIVELLLSIRGRRELTFLFISHDLALVNYLCDRTIMMYRGRIVEMLPSPATQARHPYTLELISSMPSLHRRTGGEGAASPREKPAHVNPAGGCHFAAHCPSAQEKCLVDSPELRSVDAGHSVACHLISI